ncbi:peptide chain release factor N(5)-glutamine methyltransferase [Leucobacter sp. W1478]|uniref:peptide chain release factor N(5)-glutamine methyltransferase n=1 Tax=Leucobacter sp. W1478 TaxID=3439065 RepID=UPI003F354752
MITVGELLRDMREVLEASGIEHPGGDAELIVAHVLGESRGRVQALALLGAEVTPVDHETILGLASERARRVPLQHLTGRAPFRSLELHVGPGVFVPRPETEIVAQFAIDALQAAPDPQPIAVDLCTGSGAIALALATEVPTATVWAVEKSREAHAWAERNVKLFGDGRVELLLGDVADTHLLAHLEGRVQVLISNPPYVPDSMVPRDAEVREHDPALALYGGADGLDIVRTISRVARKLMVPGGSLVLEHAESQGAAIRALLERDGWRHTATHRDLTLRDRATTAIR